jgi:hypothetical protein
MRSIIVDDTDLGESLFSPICNTCANYRGYPDQCLAFTCIPTVIWRGYIDHKQAYPGDKGVKYDALPKGQKPPIFPGPSRGAFQKGARELLIKAGYGDVKRGQR